MKNEELEMKNEKVNTGNIEYPMSNVKVNTEVKG